MVKVVGTPAHPLGATGVTVMVAIPGLLLVFVVVKDGMFPLPLAAKPIDVLLFVQLYMVPGMEPLNITVVVLVLAHKA